MKTEENPNARPACRRTALCVDARVRPGSTGGPSVKLFPNTNAVSTNGPARRPVMRNTPSNVEEGTVTGRSWYDPDLSLAVETIYDQTITTRSPSSNTKRVRGTNVVVTVGNNKTNALPGTNAMVVASNQSPPPPPTTTTSQWHTRIRLLEVEPLKN